MDYTERMKQLLDEKGITQGKLAKLTGVKQQTISTWMTKRYPNLKGIEKICGVLGIGVFEFFMDKDAILKVYGVTPESLDIARGLDSLTPELKERAIDLINQQLSLFLEKVSK